MRVFVFLVLSIAFLSLTACVDPNYNNGGGYSNSYDPYDPYNNDRRERYELEKERDRLERERRRLEEERKRQQDQEYSRPVAPPPPPAQRVERCPSGFSPSENKCSSEERRRGCRDMRLPGGLGCVSR